MTGVGAARRLAAAGLLDLLGLHAQPRVREHLEPARRDPRARLAEQLRAVGAGLAEPEGRLELPVDLHQGLADLRELRRLPLEELQAEVLLVVVGAVVGHVVDRELLPRRLPRL